MCGIFGGSFSSAREINITKILQSISHRGPDNSNFYSSDKKDVVLGHVRLSILDVTSAGNQPMIDKTSRYVMVYNGEVYNYHELKIGLEKKFGRIEWESSSDSEVILEGFSRENASFLDKLNGIFSILIYDIKEHLLHVLRDPIGVKPLYYTTQNGDTFFCSEIKGLLKINNVKRTLRLQSLSDQIALMYTPEPFTMYNEFFKVERGVHYIYKDGMKISEQKLYSHLNQRITFGNESEILKRFTDTFKKAVNRQLIADVPVSLFLSGGLDSSSIAYEAINQGANIHSAYTISYSNRDQQHDGQSSDLFFAKKIAKQLKLDLRVIEADQDFMTLLPGLIEFMEDGISDPAAINTYLICKSARQDGIKVLLSGQGADEYLCGYRRYIAEKYLQNMPAVFKKSLSTIGTILPNNMPGPLNALTRRIKRLAYAAGQDEIARLSGYFMWDSPTQIKKLFKHEERFLPGNALSIFFEKNKHLSPINRLLAADQQFDLLALNLAYSDKMSMAVGVEARVPFLDFELVRLMNSLPEKMKIRGNTQKYILKKVMEDKLPNEVIYRSKAGFALPIRSWFKQKNSFIEYYFDREKLKRQDIFNADEIIALYQDQLTGRKDNSYILFALLCQQIWLEKNL